jgi:hypothetical protein
MSHLLLSCPLCGKGVTVKGPCDDCIPEIKLTIEKVKIEPRERKLKKGLEYIRKDDGTIIIRDSKTNEDILVSAPFTIKGRVMK